MTGFNDLIAASGEAVIMQDLRVRAGTNWQRGWTLLDSAGLPIDFNGCTATLLVKDKPNGTTKISFTNTLTGGKQVTLANGSVGFTATPAATTGLATTANWQGVYELRVTKGADVVTLVYGKIVIYPAI